MVNKNVNRGRGILVLKIGIALLPISYQPISFSEQFLDDSTLKGGLYYWQRDRSRKELNPESDKYKKYVDNLKHSTVNASLDYSSGYFQDVIGLDLAAFTAIELSNSTQRRLMKLVLVMQKRVGMKNGPVIEVVSAFIKQRLKCNMVRFGAEAVISNQQDKHY